MTGAYDYDSLPAIGARVRHYADGDIGSVTAIGYRGLDRGRLYPVQVRWDSDPDFASMHAPDELLAAA